MADHVNGLQPVLYLFQSLGIKESAKIAFLVIAIACLCTVIPSFAKVYDVTLISRMDNATCAFVRLEARTGDPKVGRSGKTLIAPKGTHHYQVVPSWKSFISAETQHIRIKCNDVASVIIPVYNSGDIQRSQVFFIEKDGLREAGTTKTDTWPWSEEHQFEQQGD